MDIEYREVISFARLGDAIERRGLRVRFIEERIGLTKGRVSRFIKDMDIPKSDIVAKMAFVLKMPVSEITEFKNITQNPYFADKQKPYAPPLDAVGELTYRPLWNFLDSYIGELNTKPDITEKKTANSLFDRIEPPRRRNGLGNIESARDSLKMAMEARGMGEGYKPKTNYKRKDYSKGLPATTRTKLRNDRPLSIRTIYDICYYLGCSVDWVLSYK